MFMLAIEDGVVASRACWFPSPSLWPTDMMRGNREFLLFSLKTDQNLLGFEERSASRELKKSVRLAEIIFLTRVLSSLNMFFKASVGDFLSFFRTASFLFRAWTIPPLIHSGEFRPLIILVGM